MAAMSDPAGNPPTLPAPPRRRRIWNWLLISIVGLTALLCVSPIVLLWLRSLPYRRAVEAELERIRSAGEPTTPAELEEFYSSCVGDVDCTLVSTQALEPLFDFHWPEDVPSAMDSSTELPQPGHPWPQGEQAMDLLDAHQQTLRALHEAAACGGPARYPTEFSQGISAQLPHLWPMRDAVTLLLLESFVRARKGDAAGAAKSLQAAIRFPDTLACEPSLISQLARIAMHRKAIRMCEFLNLHASLNDDELQGLRTDIDASAWPEALERSLLGERPIMLTSLETSPEDDLGALERSAYQFTRWELMAGHLDLYADVVEACRQGPTALLARMEEFEEWSDELGNERRLKPQEIAAAMMLPALISATNAFVIAVAEDIAADAAIAAELFRRRHGRLPASLEELVPEFLSEVPLDPFDGQPLRLVERDGAWIAYSVGANCTDDGGLRADDPREGDVTFELRPPAGIVPDSAGQ
jgi:hypothetical protein